MSSAAPNGIGPVLYPDVPCDPLVDFTHLHLVGTVPSVVTMGPAFSGATLAEYIAQARGKPGEMTFGSGSNGPLSHLIGQLLARSAEMTLTQVPYRGSATAGIPPAEPRAGPRRRRLHWPGPRSAGALRLSG